jgi:acyl carrier protein
LTAPDPLFDRIQSLVQHVAGPSRTPESPGSATPLSDAGFWLDSVELLEVVVACESEFHITFDATTDFTDGAFATLGGLVDLIRSKLSHTGAGT